MTLQEIIVAVLIIAAAFGLFFSLRRKNSGADNGCRQCPLADDCAKKRQKSASESCTLKK